MEKQLFFQAEPALKRSSVTNLLFKTSSKLLSERRKSSINQKTDQDRKKTVEKSTDADKYKQKVKDTPRVISSTSVLTSKENQLSTPSGISKASTSPNNTFFYLKNGLKRQHSNNPQKFESLNHTLISNKEPVIPSKKTSQKSFHFDSKRDLNTFFKRHESNSNNNLDSSQNLNISVYSSSQHPNRPLNHSLHAKQKFVLPNSPVLMTERKLDEENKEVSHFEPRITSVTNGKDLKNQSFSKFLEENHFKKPKKESFEFKRRLFTGSKEKNAVNIKTISLVQKEDVGGVEAILEKTKKHSEKKVKNKVNESLEKNKRNGKNMAKTDRTLRKKFRFFEDGRKFSKKTKKMERNVTELDDQNQDLAEINANLMQSFDQELKLLNAIKKENLILKSLYEINKIFNVKLDLSSFDCFRNYPDIVIPRTEFQIFYDRLLGKGGFAEVFAGVYQKKSVAVKIITISNDYVKHLLNEIMTMMLCVHDNLVRLLALSIEEGKGSSTNEIAVYLVMELMKKDLKQIIFTDRRKFTKKAKYEILCDILKGLLFLHESNYVHCDLKLQNILLDENNVAKISDFGLAKSLRSGNTKKSLIYGYSERCSSYEYLVEERISTKGDIWSFGILAYELLKEKMSWDRLTGVQAVAKVSMKTPFFNLNERLDDPFENQLVELCLNYNYTLRPSAKELLEMMKYRMKAMI